MSATFRNYRLYLSFMHYGIDRDGSYSWLRYSVRDHRPLLHKGRKP